MGGLSHDQKGHRMNIAFQKRLAQLVTAIIFVLLFAVASCFWKNFCSTRNVADILSGTSVTGILAVGMTLVIFAGGIDLSVGSVAGFTTIFVAALVQNHGVHPFVAAICVLILGAAFGALMGTIIHIFKQPPFLVTLAGMFFARGCAFWISTQSIEIEHPIYQRLTTYSLPLGGDFGIPPTTLLMLAALLAGYIVAHHTRFGRNLLAIGGSEQSALLMGLPLGITKICAYAVCGFTAALGGLAGTLFTSSGNSRFGIGYELDAIAIVVIGGTVLTGGRGHMLGTLSGILIFGTIGNIVIFANLDSSWTRIIIGLLLLAFILLQRLLLRGTTLKST